MSNIEPTRDIVFKRLFGKVGNEAILKGFLESILEIDIEKVELDLDKEMEPIYVGEKKNILDVRAKLNNKISINIEMQIKDNKDMEKRSLYHWSKLYLHELKRGCSYDALPKTIVIVIAAYTVFEDIENYHTKWRLREETSRDKVLTDSEEIHFIEIPKFLKKDVKNPKKLDFWLWFLDNTKKERVKMATEKDLAIRRAVEELERLTADPALQRILDAEELARMDEIVLRKQAVREGLEEGIREGLQEGLKKGIEQGKKQGREEGRKQGIEEGRQEGREEGREEGRQEGKKEGFEEGKRQEKLEIVKNMLNLGIDIEKISKATELTVEEIESLKNKEEK